MDDMNESIKSLSLTCEQGQEEKMTCDMPQNDISTNADMQKNSNTETITGEMIQMLTHGNDEQQLIVTQNIRKIMTTHPNPLSDNVIQNSIIQKFVEFLERDNFQLQFEAACALNQMVSGNSSYVHSVTQSAAIPIFIKLLLSTNESVQEQVILILGNIAGDCRNCRDLLLNPDIIPALLQMLQNQCRLNITRNSVRCLANLCRWRYPPVEFSKIELILPVVAKLIYNDDIDVVAYACWTICYLVQHASDQEKIQKVIELGVCRRLVELLTHDSVSIVTPALQIIGEIVSHTSDMKANFGFDFKILENLLLLLNSAKSTIRKDACWTLSNITAEDSNHIQAVIDANIFPKLIEIISIDEMKIKKEAVWAITNAATGGTPEQIRYLIDLNVIPILCELLEMSDQALVEVVLEGLDNILKAGVVDARSNRAENPYVNMITNCDGLRKIEKLQTHQNHKIYQKTQNLIDKYFDFETEYN